MKGSSILKKINARVKQLKKKHPGAKRSTLQKQAGREFKAGKLKKKKSTKQSTKLSDNQSDNCSSNPIYLLYTVLSYRLP